MLDEDLDVEPNRCDHCGRLKMVHAKCVCPGDAAEREEVRKARLAEAEAERGKNPEKYADPAWWRGMADKWHTQELEAHNEHSAAYARGMRKESLKMAGIAERLRARGDAQHRYYCACDECKDILADLEHDEARDEALGAE